MEEQIPDACLNDNHDFGQAGRCNDCGIDRANPYVEKRTGGAGALTQPTTDREYREQMDKLQEKAGH